MAEKLLKQYLTLLEKENRLLIETINNKESTKELQKLLEQKEKTLLKILELSKEEVAPYQDILKRIDEQNSLNKELALNNLEFIGSIFSALFEEKEIKQYNQNGQIKSKQTSFINKKI